VERRVEKIRQEVRQVLDENRVFLTGNMSWKYSPPSRETSVTISNEGAQFKLRLQINIDRKWRTIEVLH
jgi:hypothetical protein